jgi:exodeoxyribonuclease VII small subunit
MGSQPDDKTPGFDDILNELAGVVERLDQGDLPLEEALERFERGVNLAREGERILGQAEKRVEVLLSNKDGDVLAPLDGAPDPGQPDDR